MNYFFAINIHYVECIKNRLFYGIYNFIFCYFMACVKFTSVVAIAALAFGATFNGAFAKDSINILTIDIEKVASESKVGKEMQDKMQKKQSSLQAKIEEKKKEISKKIESINAQKSKISEAEYNKKAEALQKDVMMLDGKFQADLQDMQEKQTTASQKLVDAVKDVAKKIALDKKAAIVIPSNVVFYSDEKHDITKEVIEALDKSGKNIDID